MSDAKPPNSTASHWYAPPTTHDESTDQRVSIAWWSLISGVGAIGVLFVVSLIVPSIQTDRFMLAASVVAVVGLVALRLGYIEVATRGTVLVIAALVYGLVLLRGGIESNSATLVSSLAVLGALVVGPRMGAALTALGSALLIAVYGFGSSTLLVRTEERFGEQYLSALLLGTLVSGLLASYAMHRGRVATAIAVDRAASIAATNTELRRARAKSEAVVASMPEPVLLTNEQGIIVLANAAASALLTTRAASGALTTSDTQGLVGQPIAALLPNGLDDAVRDAQSGRAEGRVRAMHGRELPMQVARSVLKSDDGVEEQIWVLADLSHRLEAEARTAAAAVAAEDANRSKSNFLANMSHELRTPLNAVIGYSEIVLEDLDDDALKSDVAKIHHAGQHLLSLINDVLDMSKIEAGRMEVHYEPVAVEPLLHDVISAVSDTARARKNQITWRVAPDLGLLVTDGRRVQQILTNLLSNAVKFTDGGDIHITCERTTAGVRVAVRDTGIGIAPEVLTTLFRPFMQADNSTSRRFGGTGLGLALSQRLAELLGGRIQVVSTPGTGSTFTLHLPTRAGASKKATSRLAPESLVSGDGPLVLCVDDDTPTLELLSRTLHREGFRVLTATDGPSALATLRVSRPAIVTLDLMMPDMDGWSVLRQLKDDPLLRDIPVVVVSMVDQRAAGLALGAADYLVKPVQPAVLAGALHRALLPAP